MSNQKYRIVLVDTECNLSRDRGFRSIFYASICKMCSRKQELLLNQVVDICVLNTNDLEMSKMWTVYGIDYRTYIRRDVC